VFEFLAVTGKAGAIGISLVFVVVFILAEPGKEISFWGIKFHKRYRLFKRIKWRRLPKPLPQDWIIVLRAFANFDEHHLHQDKLFFEADRLGKLSVLKTRQTFAEMEKHGLLEHMMNYVSLKEGALKLANEIKKSDEAGSV
jgi:hypothetical protein